MRKSLKFFTLAFFLVTLIGSLPVNAEENLDENMGGYTVEGVPNNHQVDDNSGYFYLKEAPSEKDKIKLKLINSSAQDKVLTIDVTNANTNSNGLLDYTGINKDHSSLQCSLTSILKPDQKEVTIPKNSTVETSLSINMPSNKQKGIIVGGIVISEKQDRQDTNKELSIGNTYSYTLGVVLTNESLDTIYKNISVELESVKPVLFDGRKIVQANILNPNPYIFSQAKISGKITKKSSKKIIKEESKNNVSIAPYSIFPFQLDWEKEDLKPGKYVFRGIVETKDNQWEFEKEFEITAEKAKEINNESVFKVQIPAWLTYTALITSIVTIGGTVWLVVRKRGKKYE